MKSLEHGGVGVEELAVWTTRLNGGKQAPVPGWGWGHSNVNLPKEGVRIPSSTQVNECVCVFLLDICMGLCMCVWDKPIHVYV